MSPVQRGLDQALLTGARHTVRHREDLVNARKIIAGRGLQNDSGVSKGREKPAIQRHKNSANISPLLGNLSSQIEHASQLALRPQPLPQPRLRHRSLPPPNRPTHLVILNEVSGPDVSEAPRRPTVVELGRHALLEGLPATW